jgi:hypothetical protein
MEGLKAAWRFRTVSHLGRLEVWQVGFDFKDGLPMPEGEVYLPMASHGRK